MSKHKAEPSPTEVEKRLSRILRGAFAGPPTHLKDIPKKRVGARKTDSNKGKSSRVE